MAHQYFSEPGELLNREIGEIVSVRGEEARHAVKVSRLRLGEIIRIADGEGNWAAGEAVTAESDLLQVKIAEIGRDKARPFHITVIQALAKNSRDELAIELATELGADSVVPWQAARSIVKWDDSKAKKNLFKWERITSEASKQCLRARTPRVLPLIKGKQLEEFLTKHGSSLDNGLVFVLHPAGKKTLRESLENVAAKKSTQRVPHIVFIVGPEGGVSSEELQRLAQIGAAPVLLGDEVLRTSTAGAAAIAVANVIFKHW